MKKIEPTDGLVETRSSRKVRLGRLGKKALATGVSFLATATYVNSEARAIPGDTVKGQNIPTLNNEAVAGEAVQKVGSEDGAVTVNGQKTLIIGVWQGGGQAGGEYLKPGTLSELGANTVLNASMQTARQLEGQAWVSMSPDINGGAPLPNQIWNEGPDEPDGYNVLPSQMPSFPNNGLPNDENFTQHLADGVDPSTIITQNDYPQYLKQLGPNAVVTDDFYPLNRTTLGYRAPGYFYHFAISERNRVEQETLGGAQTPFGGWIEANRIDVNSQNNPVTPELAQAEIKALFTAGATIEKVWTWSWVANPDGSADPNAVDPEVAAAIKEQNQQIQDHSYIFLAPRLDNIDSKWSDPVKLGGHYITGPNGEKTYYIIMFNSTPDTITVRQKLPQLKNQSVTEVLSGQVTPNNNGTVQVTIPRFDWVIESYDASAAHISPRTTHATTVHVKRTSKSHRSSQK